MGGFGWRRALTHVVTVRRNTTAVSGSGSTKFVYVDLLTGVVCSIQSDGGRMVQADVGQKGFRHVSVLFGEEMIGQLQQNDQIVDQADGRVFRLVRIHEVTGLNAPHVEASAEQVVTAGGD